MLALIWTRLSWHDTLVLHALSSAKAQASLRKYAHLLVSYQSHCQVAEAQANVQSMLVLTAHKSQFDQAHRILVLWRWLRLAYANVQTDEHL